MWVLRKLRAPRVNFRRNILLLVMGLAMAVFASVGPLASTALAADAEWSGDALLYEEKLYTRAILPDETDRDGFINTYESRDTTTIPPTRYVMYLPDGEVSDATSATLIVYNVVGGEYRPISEPTEVNIIRDLTETADDPNTNCNVSGIGWIICPLSNYLAEGVDWVYGIVSNFFEVQTITKSDNGVYELWTLVRTIANVAFIGVFLAIIYSQITGAGYSNYNIKNMIPRLILAAALVNVSFWLCALAVDASNLLGHSIQALLENIRQNYVTPIDIPWSAVTAAILGGGTVAGIAGFAAATAGSGFSFSFLLLAALIPAGLSVLAAFIILAARQALIVVLTAVAPLAFVASVLPSTRGLFDKWRKLFTNMLIIFPAFALLFGASQLAGSAIIKTATEADQSLQLALVLVGLAIQVIPLALTPFLTRLSSGILGQVANFANNKQRGFSDRAKNWAQDNADMHKSRKLAGVASDIQRRRDGEYMGRLGGLRARGIGRIGYNMDRKKRDRDAYKKQSEELLANQHEEDWERRLAEPSQPGPVRQRLGISSIDQRTHRQHSQAHRLHEQATTRKAAHDAHHELEWGQYLDSQAGAEFRNLRRQAHLDKGVAKVYDDDMTNADELALKAMVNNSPLRARATRAGRNAKEAAAHQASIDATVQEQWTQREHSTPELRNMRQRTELAKKRAEDIDKSMSASDQRRYDELVDTSPAYTEIRQAKVQTVVDSSHSDLRSKRLKAEGNKLYRDEFKDDAPGGHALREIETQTVYFEKEAAEVESTIKERAEKRWERRSRRDADLQKLRLKRIQATDEHKKAELQWNTLVEQARANGSSAPVASGNQALAGSLQEIMVDTSAYESGIQNIKDDQKSHILKQLNTRKSLREVAGGGTQFGETKVLAQAQSGITKMVLDNAKAMTSIYSNDGYSVNEMFKAMNTGGELRNNQPTDEVAKLAAIQYVMEDIGNNWAVEKTIDRMIRDHGMEIAKDAQGNVQYGADGNPIYYDAKAFRDAKRTGGPLPAALTESEVAERRDLLQMVVGGYRNGKNKVSWFANTMQESTNRGISTIKWQDERDIGRDMTASEAAILTEIRAGKYSGERIAKMDPDELSRMIQSFRDDKYRGLITDEQRQNVLSGILEAQTSEQTRHTIKPRERGLMNIVASYLEKGSEQIDADERRRIENVYYEVELGEEGNRYSVRVPEGTQGAKQVWSAMAAPTQYDMDRQDDIGPTGLGLYGPGQRPYTPDTSVMTSPQQTNNTDDES